MEEKYNQLDDDNASDTEKSKGLITPEKKSSTDGRKESESTTPASVPSASKNESKEDDDQDSDHEDTHGISLINYLY